MLNSTNTAHTKPIDVVYTWVDDSFPGYLEQLNQYAETKHDLNPNRTRDNLDLLKYSLRSLQQHLPWVRHVYLFTCRPQIPAWINTQAENLKIIHHDEIIDPQYLPTFSSHTIISHIHKLPGLSDQFLYIEDDMLFDNRVRDTDFTDKQGKIIFYPQKHFTADAKQRDSETQSPWNLALAECNHMLDDAFTKERRRDVNHIPLFVDRKAWGEMEQRWPDAFHRTRMCKFRSPHNVAAEYLYPYYMIYTNRGTLTSRAYTRRNMIYHPMENYLVWAWYGIWRINRTRPKFLALNDNFDDKPHAGVVSTMKNFLAHRYPTPSRFESIANAEFQNSAISHPP